MATEGWRLEDHPPPANSYKELNTHTPVSLSRTNAASVGYVGLWYYDTILQNVTVGGNWAECTRDLSLSYFISLHLNLVLPIKK